MDGLEDFFVRPVDGHSDVLAFRHDFEVKALDDRPTVVENDEGDLIIEGWAASFDGLDRQGENFVEGAFERGIKAFLEGQAALCFHHKHDQPIGRVLDLREEEGKGLWMRARVDFQPESSPLRHIYNGIKKGTINALSVGGFFRRALVKGRKMITSMDFTEVSACAVPVHPKTKFAVVAGKALEGFEVEEAPEEEHKADPDFTPLAEALDRLRDTLDKHATKAEEEPEH